MKDGHRNDCKECFNEWHNEYSRKRSTIPEIAEIKRNKQAIYNVNNPDVNRRSALLRKFNITLEEYEELLVKQNGLCAICKEPERSKRKKYLAVDHCHETGRIRGLLCSTCNVGLGALGDSIEGIRSALAYLEENSW